MSLDSVVFKTSWPIDSLYGYPINGSRLSTAKSSKISSFWRGSQKKEQERGCFRLLRRSLRASRSFSPVCLFYLWSNFLMIPHYFIHYFIIMIEILWTIVSSNKATLNWNIVKPQKISFSTWSANTFSVFQSTNFHFPIFSSWMKERISERRTCSCSRWLYCNWQPKSMNWGLRITTKSL